MTAGEARPLRRLGLWLGLALALGFVAFPALDLTVSGWFYRPEQGFFLGRDPLFEFLRKGMPSLLIGSALFVFVLGVLGEILRQPFLGVDRRIAAYVVLSLALGPGMLVNSVLKENWGRARPSQIVEFGGGAQYSPPLLWADQCVSNCSFSSGHAALGFWVVAYALLVPPPWRRPAIAAALVVGGLFGLGRIAQGGHFLSDVLFSAAITIGVTALLHRWLVAGHRG